MREVHVHPQYITSSIHNIATPSPLIMGETKNYLHSQFVWTLVEHLVGGISTVTVGSDNAKSITSST